MYTTLLLQVERQFLGFEHVTSRSQGRNLTVVPRLILTQQYYTTAHEYYSFQWFPFKGITKIVMSYNRWQCQNAPFFCFKKKGGYKGNNISSLDVLLFCI